jgi:S-adenosylmethionine decarboxylase
MSGRHLKVLGRGDPFRLRRPQEIRRFLEDLIRALEMRILGEPVVYEVEQDIQKLGKEPFEDEGGVTGIAVLSTSHVAIHTWPLRAKTNREMFVLDIYSCRDFKNSAVTVLVKERFRGEGIKLNDLSSALVYP